MLRRFFSARKPASIPPGRRVYAVGDIHGRADLLERLTAAIAEDAKGANTRCQIIYLGDYVDRGAETRRVIDLLLTPPAGFEVVYLRGNHDQIMLDFLADPSVFRLWRDYGARETLLSYGLTPPRFEDEAAFGEASDRLRETLPSSHLDFLTGTRFSVRMGDYAFVHAGVRPGIPLDRQAPEDLMWIREDFLASKADFGALVVHGHTPAERPVVRPNRIGIDTGAYATGRLTAAVLEGSSCRFLHT